MKRRWKQISAFMLCCLIVLGGCSADGGDVSSTLSEETGEVVLVEAEEEYAESGEVARSGVLSLEWDGDRAALLLKENDRVVWGSLPSRQYETRELGGGAKRYAESHLVISYIEPGSLIVKTANSYTGAFEDGRLYSRQIENGIRITYYFDDVGIVVPVEYTLVDGALQASIDVKGIHEDSYKLLQISLLPYCASASNSKENYLFVPDGSGVLMNCDQEKGMNTFWSPVYGRDPIVVEEIKMKNTASARLPVFGVKNGNAALCGIITEGEGAAELNAVTGEPDITYSNVYASFLIRGSDSVKIPDLYGKKQSIAKFSAGMIDLPRLTVRYYPLHPEKQAYSEMADCYRNYLITEKGLKKQGEDQPLYYDIPMAADRRKFYFGFPFDVTEAVTTYETLEKILAETIEQIDLKPVVRLSGIQKGGLRIGELAGGFRFESAVGSEGDRKALFASAAEKGIPLYPDFDLVRFSKGGFGSLSAAKAPTTMTSYQYFYHLATKDQNVDQYRYMLLSPSKLENSFDKLSDFLSKKEIDSLSLSTLSSMAYSDYSEAKYYLRGGFASTVEEILSAAKENGLALMTEEANAYAAVAASHILSSPTKTSRFFGETEQIPFYQMVFKGMIPMSSMAVNLQDDPEKELLLAAGTGIGLLYTLCGNETLDFAASPATVLSAGSYQRMIPEITKAAARFAPAFEAGKGAGIDDYIKLADGVYQTVYTNKASVIVNYSDVAYTDGGHSVAPMDFIVENGGEAK